MRKLKYLAATVLASLSIGAAVAPAAHATAATNAVYRVYNRDCGGYNPWHHTYWSQLVWQCENRRVELQQLWKRGRYADVDYCYTEWKPGSKHERCMEVRTYQPPRRSYAVIDNMLAYWTND